MAEPGLERGVTVVVPTLREAASLPALLDRLGRLREAARLDLEVLIMDDASRDGTVEIIERHGAAWVRLIERAANPGLAAAVLDGFQLARRESIVVLDADLSHPPEAIPELLARLDGGDELAIGSRFAPGGSVAASWGLGRRWLSRAARLLARPLAPTSDPLAGFFAFRRSLLDRADALHPIGFKIGLELMVKARCRRVGEVPIHFAERRAGRSKLTAGSGLDYLRHLGRLYAYRLRGPRRSSCKAQPGGGSGRHRLPAGRPPTRGS